MALNTLKCNYLTPLGFKGLTSVLVADNIQSACCAELTTSLNILLVLRSISPACFFVSFYIYVDYRISNIENVTS